MNIMNAQAKADLLNISQAWVHCLLYYANLYPKQSFERKTLYGIELPVSKSKAVKQYVNKIFKTLQNCIQNISFIQIQVFTPSTLRNDISEKKKSQQFEIQENTRQNQSSSTTYRLYYDCYNQVKGLENRLQKQMQLKRFLNQMKKDMEQKQDVSVSINKKQLTWKFRMQYRYEQKKVSRTDLLDSWVQTHQNKIEERVIDSLKLPNMQVIAINSIN